MLEGGVQKPRRNRVWIWFFVALAVLTVLLIGIQIGYRWSHQLTLAQLEEAQTRWKQNGPRNYEMEYTVKRGDNMDVYEVRVRDGLVISLTLNGQPVEARFNRYSTMPALFGFIRDFLEADAQPGETGKRRVYMAATFDRADGHLTHFVRSVSGTRERVEITVEFHASTAAMGPPS
jgi:hypothetical protein